MARVRDMVFVSDQGSVRVRKARWVGVKLTERGFVDVYEVGGVRVWDAYPGQWG